MSFLNNLKISTRLVMLLGILSALLIAIGGIGLFGISKSNAALKSVYEDRTVPMGQIAEIQSLLLRNRLAIAATLAESTPADVVKNTADVEANIASIGKVWEAYMATTLTPDEEKLAKAGQASPGNCSEDRRGAEHSGRNDEGRSNRCARVKQQDHGRGHTHQC